VCTTYNSIDLKKLDDVFTHDIEHHEDVDIVYKITNNNRIYMFDLYQYELNNIVKKNITLDIINDLKTAYFAKNKLDKNINQKIINIYIRCGDNVKTIFKNMIHDNGYLNFEYIIFSYVWDYIKSKNNIDEFKNYEFNIISAGSDHEMDEIKNNNVFINKKVNFIFNKSEEDVFKLMILSDVLIYSHSSFPFTASLYSNGFAIKRRNDSYFSTVCLNNFMFINHVFIDSIDETDNLKLIDTKLNGLCNDVSA
jgi:hypothetical protein